MFSGLAGKIFLKVGSCFQFFYGWVGACLGWTRVRVGYIWMYVGLHSRLFGSGFGGVGLYEVASCVLVSTD